MSEVTRIRDDEFAVSPGGLHIGHTNLEVDYLKQVIEHEEIQAFIEVGVHVGGLTDVVVPMVECYLGLEIHPDTISPVARETVDENHGASFLIGDAWSAEILIKVVRWVQDKGLVFIYCDGGDKTKELTLYSEWVAPGDLIGVHDYGVYEGSEIDPEYADQLMEDRDFIKYRPSFRPELARIEIWRA